MAITEQEFRNALATFASGVTVVTAASGGRPHGLTVSAFCSVSLEPPLVLVCIERSARCHEIFGASGRLAVNVLGEHQRFVSERFAAQIDDKFEGIEYSVNEHGIPVLAGAVAVLECSVRDSFDGGDHTIFVLKVENAEVSGGRPLLYFEGEYRAMGA